MNKTPLPLVFGALGYLFGIAFPSGVSGGEGFGYGIIVGFLVAIGVAFLPVQPLEYGNRKKHRDLRL